MWWHTVTHGRGSEGGNWRMEWVASTLHTTSEHGVSSITTADGHTTAASSCLNWRPCRFKRIRPFRRKTSSGFGACDVTFQMQSTASFWTRGSGRGGKLRVLRLWLMMLGMTLTSDETNRMAVVLFVCHCYFISNATSWYLLCFSVIVTFKSWVNGITTWVNVASLFVQSTSSMADLVKVKAFFFNPLALELDIYSLAHLLCKMWIFYEPRRITLGNTRHFVEE